MKTVPILFLSFLFTTASFGQSIFSANYLGEINIFAGGKSVGMGGMGVGVLDPLTINRLNPAAWAVVDLTRLNIHSSYENVTVQAAEGTRQSVDTDFNGVQFLIPIHKKLVVAGGFLPFTHSTYDWFLEGSTSDTAAFPYEKRIETRGGITDFQFGIGYRISPKWNLGVSANYFFGKTENRVAIYFPDLRSSDTKITDRIFGWAATLGVTSHPIENWSFGLAFRFPAHLSSKIDTTYISTATTEISYHTLDLPYQLSLGIAYEFSPRWTGGMDLILTNWKSGYKRDSQTLPESRDFLRFGTGVEYTGSRDPFAPFFQKLTYRSGFYYQQWYYAPEGNPLKDRFLTAGIGIPFARQKNRFDVAIELGWRGDKTKTGAREQILRISASISAGEKWFERNVE